MFEVESSTTPKNHLFMRFLVLINMGRIQDNLMIVAKEMTKEERLANLEIDELPEVKSTIKKIRNLDAKVNHMRDEFIEQAKDRKFGLQEKSDEKDSISKFLKLEKAVDKVVASR